MLLILTLTFCRLLKKAFSKVAGNAVPEAYLLCTLRGTCD
jgi:hypothetical protein